MNPPRNLDASQLPDHAFGSRTVLGWGTWGFIAIEGGVFAVLGATLLYGMSRADTWPPPPWGAPPLACATIITVLLLLTVIPQAIGKRAAERLAIGPARAWLGVVVLLQAGVLVARAVEFGALEVRWDDNFFGSILWTTLGFHTLLVASNLVESAVLLVLSFRRHIRPHRLADMADSAFYGFFSAAVWMPLYFLFYVLPRL